MGAMSGDLAEAELAELHALESAAGVDSLIEFVPRITPRWVPPWHLAPVAELFVRAEYEPVRACVSVPPRHGKTELILHAIAWWLSRHPATPIIYTSYADALATAKSKRALDLARDAEIPLRSDIAAASDWQTPAGGGVRATGVGGGITGHGAGIFIVDDPIKNREEAESPAVRKKVWEWFLSTCLTRLEPGASIIVVHTRWHEDDLIGRLKRERADSWEFINLPAVNDNKPLWPERWPLDELAKKRKEVGEYDWWALYMGMPSPKGGSVFKRHWWRFYQTGWGTSRPDDCSDEPAIARPALKWLLISVDAAFKKKLTGSRVSMLVVGGDGTANRYVVDNRTAPMSFAETCDNIRLLKKQYPNALRVLIEDKANGPAVIETLHAEIPGIIAINPQGGKESRAAATQPSVESGNYYLPEGADWLDDFVTELALFPSAANDDQVDSFTQQHIYMSKGLDVIRAQMLGEW
jgi:predicted phage terminase large subunit-like protein